MIRFLLEGDESGGSAALFEFDRARPGRGCRWRTATTRYEETVYGLEGTLTWTVEGDRHEVGPGEVLCIRRGAVHRFENEGEVDARVLAVVTPGELGPGLLPGAGRRRGRGRSCGQPARSLPGSAR